VQCERASRTSRTLRLGHVVTVWFLPRLLSQAQLLIYPLALVAVSELVLIAYKSLVFIDRAVVIALSVVNGVYLIPKTFTVVRLDKWSVEHIAITCQTLLAAGMWPWPLHLPPTDCPPAAPQLLPFAPLAHDLRLPHRTARKRYNQ
jgi:hypothetical protein